MTRSLFTATRPPLPTSPICWKKPHQRVPIVRDGKVVGIVSRATLPGARKHADKACTRRAGDLDIRAKVISRLNASCGGRAQRDGQRRRGRPVSFVTSDDERKTAQCRGRGARVKASRQQ
jgi:hypothetical protein